MEDTFISLSFPQLISYSIAVCWIPQETYDTKGIFACLMGLIIAVSTLFIWGWGNWVIFIGTYVARYFFERWLEKREQKLNQKFLAHSPDFDKWANEVFEGKKTTGEKVRKIDSRPLLKV